MSRSNPTTHISNPATRWFEWNGEVGEVRFYDKALKTSINVGPHFTFLLLDQLGSVGGWHDASTSSIYSNEVRDTRQETLVVKAFKGGTLAEGIYRDIRDRVAALGGQFVAVCYLAYKTPEGALALGAIKFKGAALNAWVEFTKAHRADLYTHAVAINGYTEGKKGRIVFRVPNFTLVNVSDATQEAATKLDVQLQTYLTGYLSRTTHDRVEPSHVSDESFVTDDDYDTAVPTPADDDLPF